MWTTTVWFCVVIRCADGSCSAVVEVDDDRLELLAQQWDVVGDDDSVATTIRRL
jgi:hypothetical protein